MQGSNDTTQTVTQDSNNSQVFPKGYRLPETDDAKVLPTSDQVGLYLTSIHQMAPLEHTSNKPFGYVHAWKISEERNTGFPMKETIEVVRSVHLE